MLKKLEFYYDEDGEKIDISDEKIYWDTNKNQFRHQFKCCACNKPIGCRCFDDLSSLISQIDDGIICKNCGISEALNNLFITDILDIFDADRINQVNKYLETLVTEEDIKEYMEYIEVTNLDEIDNMDIIEGTEKEDRLREFAISLMTEDEKLTEFYENCDCADGELCNI